MTEKYDYAGASDWCDKVEELAKRIDAEEAFTASLPTIRRALKLAPLAEKVMGEPSEGMIKATREVYLNLGNDEEGNEFGRWGLSPDESEDIFKAMIAQAQKEIDDE